jgi:hypothetical protein
MFRRMSLPIPVVLALACRGAVVPDDPVLPACDVPELGAPVPLRRLTAAQLARTVEAALGVTVTYDISDEQLLGYRANTSLAIDDTTAREILFVAEAVAPVVTRGLLGAPDCTVERCADHLLDTVGLTLFRRPLEPDERAPFHGVFAAGLVEGGLGNAVRWQLEAMLQSPRFLYQLERSSPAGRLDGFSVASRLSFALWDAPPDAAALAAAASGALDDPAGVAALASSMIDDPRFDDGIEAFAAQWLLLDSLSRPDARPDVFLLPAETRDAMRREPIRYVARAVREGHGVPELLTRADAPDEPALAALYGEDRLGGDGQVATFDPARRGGLVTLAGVQAALAHAGETSPTRRGTVVLSQLLCRPPSPPPANVVPSLPPASGGETTRERFQRHFSDPSCASCHATIDGIGFAYEHYDPLGAWRTTENGHPVDAATSFVFLGETITVTDGVDLGVALGDHPETARCVARQLTRFATSLPDSDPSRCLARDLADAAGGPDGLRAMLLALVTSDWFLSAPPELPR